MYAALPLNPALLAVEIGIVSFGQAIDHYFSTFLMFLRTRRKHTSVCVIRKASDSDD